MGKESKKVVEKKNEKKLAEKAMLRHSIDVLSAMENLYDLYDIGDSCQTLLGESVLERAREVENDAAHMGMQLAGMIHWTKTGREVFIIDALVGLFCGSNIVEIANDIVAKHGRQTDIKEKEGLAE